MASGFDGTIRIDSKIDTKGFNQGVKSLEGGLSPVLGVLTKIAAAVAAAFAIEKVVSFTVGVTKLAAKFERLQIAAEAVGQLHGFASEQTDKLTQSMINNGIQTDVANRSFINFAQNGLDANLLPALARGAQDLAVFADSGETSSDVLDRLSYGILTLNELMLRRANVAVDISTAEADYAKKLGTTSEALTVQQKRTAVSIAVLEKLKDVQGLYTLSQKTAAGQLSSNVRIMNEFKAAIGGAFQGAFYKLIKGWNDLVKVMTAAITTGGALHDLFVQIGTVAAFLADVLVGLFRAIATLFGVDLSNAVNTASSELSDEASTANDAADAQNNLADATTAADKAAKGALASFDELNVLQQDTGGATTPTPESSGFPTTQAADFSGILDEIDKKQKEIEDRVAALKAKFSDFFGPLIIALQNYLLPALASLGGTVWDGLVWVWENILVPFGQWFVDNLLPVLIRLGAEILNLANNVLKALGVNVGDALTAMKPFLAFLGDLLIAAIDWLADRIARLNYWIQGHQKEWQTLMLILAGVAVFLVGTLGGSIAVVIALIVGIGLVLANAGKAWQMFKDLVVLGAETLKNIFRVMVYDIQTNFMAIFNFIKNFAKGIFNDIIGFINGMISRITTGINSIIYAANAAGSILPGFNPIGFVPTPQIPYLATGAVIPPNARFLAVLGDQKSGRNIEAPEGLIRQIIREELGNQNVAVTMTVDGDAAGKALVSMLHPKLQAESRRIGPSLAKGAA